jgi:ribosomal protein S18 acetylase RimI-like enzyme
MIRPITTDDAAACARLHYDAMPGTFLCEFGIGFLKVLYRRLAVSPDCVGFVCVEDGEVVGLLTASEDMGAFLKRAMVKDFFGLSVRVVARLITRPRLLKSVVETFFYGMTSEQEDVTAELVSIGVRSDRRGEGIGRWLCEALEEHFRRRGIGKYTVVARAQNQGANRFYEKLGFKLGKTFRLHGIESNRYTYDISTGAR